VGPTDFLGGAVLSGFRLEFDKPNIKAPGEGFANLEPDPDSEVFGGLFELSKKQLELLDGFFGGYAQRDVSVQVVHDGERGMRVQAVTWVARRTRSGLVPSEQTVEWARRALDENGAPDEHEGRLLEAVPESPRETG